MLSKPNKVHKQRKKRTLLSARLLKWTRWKQCEMRWGDSSLWSPLTIFLFLFFLFNTFFFKSGTFHRVVELPFESCLTHLISPSSLSLGCKRSKKCSNPNLKRFNCSIAFIAIAQHALTASSLPQTRTSLANFRSEHTLFVRFSQACLIKKEKSCFSTGNKFSKHAAKKVV